MTDLNQIWTVETDIRKILKYEILMKIRPVEAEFFRVDGQTDRHDEADSHFSQIDVSAKNIGHLVTFIGLKKKPRCADGVNSYVI